MKKLILTKEEITKIEKETRERFGISDLILMENAGRESFYIIKKELKSVKNRKFFVFCGKGNNGGDGFVLSRYLFNYGVNVKVFYFGEISNFTEISLVNFDILNKLKVDIDRINVLKLKDINIGSSDVVVDAILGIGIKGVIEGEMKTVIEFINKNSNFIVSIDIPSGLDADTGEIHGVCIKSNLTISMGFLKKGFFIGKGPEYTGKIKLVDIGFPRYYYEKNN
ncbi:MAG: NAD(P)H-hydrate epimerase [Candidatus Omnitrophica bacterium]|nr:NAD(P)H-hydrate epimerase [Candidatus Omnitrophota bacterium]MCM8802795.1 NAD(P)H-hydrate epimerase [Candidatus Omnitrophota bacterium]